MKEWGLLSTFHPMKCMAKVLIFLFLAFKAASTLQLTYIQWRVQYTAKIQNSIITLKLLACFVNADSVNIFYINSPLFVVLFESDLGEEL